MKRPMMKTDQQPQRRWHADRSVWLIWLGLILLAIAILPFAVRNIEIVRQVAVMCGFIPS
ncbi:hypothetical protein OBB02_00205 [Candidatus Puniceispirillum sp.]|nr:hypothetical protein [Candidatus Puniceispirillum sp.]